MLYENLLRPLIFRLSKNDSEVAHDKAIAVLKRISQYNWLTQALELAMAVRSTALEQEFFGLTFATPVILAAGFEKNCVALHALAAMFSSVEAGTVTRYEQKGEARPRAFRFPKDRAIINRMGFPNMGSVKVAAQLASTGKLAVPLGINIGKSKITPLDEAVSDYLYSLRTLYSYADYFAINVSSPNTPGLRKLQEKKYLRLLLNAVLKKSKELAGEKQRKPILVKISPDLSKKALDALLLVCSDCGIDGLIAVNTTTSRRGLRKSSTDEVGGLSGQGLFYEALNTVGYIRQQMPTILIIGVGGIFGPEDAYKMFGAGANLLGVLTSFVFKGPFIARKINKGLCRLMARDGITHLSQLHP